MRLISARVPAVTLMRMRRSFLALLCATAVAGVSAQTTGPRTHRLEATPETVAYGYYWSEAKPALRIASGDIVDVDTLLTNSPAGLARAGVRLSPARTYCDVRGKRSC